MGLGDAAKQAVESRGARDYGIEGGRVKERESTRILGLGRDLVASQTTDGQAGGEKVG